MNRAPHERIPFVAVQQREKLQNLMFLYPDIKAFQ